MPDAFGHLLCLNYASIIGRSLNTNLVAMQENGVTSLENMLEKQTMHYQSCNYLVALP